MKDKSSWRLARDWQTQLADHAHRPSETEDLGNGQFIPAPDDEPFATDVDEENESPWLATVAAEAIFVHDRVLRRRAEIQGEDPYFQAYGMSRAAALRSYETLCECLRELEGQLLRYGIVVRRHQATERRQLAALIDPRPRTLHGKTLSKGSA